MAASGRFDFLGVNNVINAKYFTYIVSSNRELLLNALTVITTGIIITCLIRLYVNMIGAAQQSSWVSCSPQAERFGRSSLSYQEVQPLMTKMVTLTPPGQGWGKTVWSNGRVTELAFMVLESGTEYTPPKGQGVLNRSMITHNCYVLAYIKNIRPLQMTFLR